MGQGNQREDGQRIQDGCHQQRCALAPAVREGAQNRRTNGRADPHRPGRCSADGIGAAHGRDQGQRSDGQHGKRETREQAERNEALTGQLRQPGESAAGAGRADGYSISR